MSAWLSQHWIDLIVIAFLGYYAFDGYRRGFIILGLEVLGFFAALMGALWFFAPVGVFMSARLGIALPFAKALSFFVLWAAVELIYPFFAKVLYAKIPEAIKYSVADHLLGPLPSLVDGLLTLSLIFSLIVALPLPGSIKHTLLASTVGGQVVSRTQNLEQAMSSAFGGAIQETLAFLTVKEGSGETINLHFTTTDFHVDQDAEKKMVDLVNAERVAHGLRSLRVDAAMTAIARDHGADMLRRGYFSHVTPEGLTPSDRAERAGIAFLVYGENMALAPDLALAHNGLMNSPGHRANILSVEYSRIGIGVQDAGVYGIVFVQEFAD